MSMECECKCGECGNSGHYTTFGWNRFCKSCYLKWLNSGLEASDPANEHGHDYKKVVDSKHEDRAHEVAIAQSRKGHDVKVVGPDWVTTYRDGVLISRRENSAAVAERHQALNIKERKA